MKINCRTKEYTMAFQYICSKSLFDDKIRQNHCEVGCDPNFCMRVYMWFTATQRYKYGMGYEEFCKNASKKQKLEFLQAFTESIRNNIEQYNRV